CSAAISEASSMTLSALSRPLTVRTTSPFAVRRIFSIGSRRQREANARPATNAESIEVGARFDWPEFHQLVVSGTGGRTCYCFVRLPRKRFLSIPSARIFVSSVDRAMPSRVAAPVGPYTRPPLARRASSIRARSWWASVLGQGRLFFAGVVASQL